MNLHLIHSKKFKTTTICFLLRRRLTRDEVTANALIPNILKRGSKDYKNLSEIYGKTENMYGAVFDAAIVKKGEEQILQFFIEVVKKEDIVEEAFAFLNSIIFCPLVSEESFDEDIVGLEKENLRKGIEGRVNDKKEYARLRAIEETCAGEPFGIYGDGYLEDIEGLDGKKLYAQYRKIIETSPLEVIVIGDEDEGTLRKILKGCDNCEQIKRNALTRPDVVSQRKNEHTVKESMDISQGKLCVSLRTGAEPAGGDYYALLLMNEALGGGSNSKLFMNVREKESLCYNISSNVYRSKMLLLIQAGVDEENFEKAIGLIKEQISALAKKDVGEDELENARQGLINRFKGIEDYPSATMDFYLGQYLMNDSDRLEDVREKIGKVSLEKISERAGKLWVDTVYLLGKHAELTGREVSRLGRKEK